MASVSGFSESLENGKRMQTAAVLMHTAIFAFRSRLVFDFLCKKLTYLSILCFEEFRNGMSDFD